MPVGFGFSVGDFVSVVNLVRDLVKALQDTGGSSKEYLQLVAELRSLETFLAQVEAQYTSVEDLAQRVALDQAVEACKSCVDDFLQGLVKYHGHLSLVGTKSKIRDALRKVQWHLTKAEELDGFRLRISAHVQSIQTLLITIQVSSLATTRKRGDSRDRAQTQQTATLTNMNHSVVLLKASFDDLRQRLVGQGAVCAETLAGLDTFRNLMIAHNLQILSSIGKLQGALPPQVLLKQPVTFLDALNRVAPIHLEWIACWEAFYAVLEIRFQHLGQEKVRRKEFTLEETATRKALNRGRPLDVCLSPGQCFDMSMVFHDVSNPSPGQCPHCHLSCPGPPEEGIECPNCTCHFRRITQLEDDELPSTRETQTPTRTSHRQARDLKAAKSENVYPSDFKRLYLMHNGTLTQKESKLRAVHSGLHSGGLTYIDPENPIMTDISYSEFIADPAQRGSELAKMEMWLAVAEATLFERKALQSEFSELRMLFVGMEALFREAEVQYPEEAAQCTTTAKALICTKVQINELDAGIFQKHVTSTEKLQARYDDMKAKYTKLEEPRAEIQTQHA